MVWCAAIRFRGARRYRMALRCSRCDRKTSASPRSSPMQEVVRFRGKLGHRAFHGATELLQIECADGLKFSVRAAARTDWQGEVEFEFDPADAVPVRESAERT